MEHEPDLLAGFFGLGKIGLQPGEGLGSGCGADWSACVGEARSLILVGEKDGVDGKDAPPRNGRGLQAIAAQGSPGILQPAAGSRELLNHTYRIAQEWAAGFNIVVATFV